MALVGRILEGFLFQADACREMGSSFTALLCEVLADGLDNESALGRRIAAWPGHPNQEVLPLRAAGGLNYLVLTGAAPELARRYPPNPLPSPADLQSTLRETIRTHDEFLTAFLDSPPQTNEVSRSAAILVGALEVATRFDLPLEIFEVGASAGLNQGFDGYRYEVGALEWGDPHSPVVVRGDWSGPPPLLEANLRVGARRGCDQRPLDPTSPEDRVRLLCYIWPDQIPRVERLRAALDLAALDPPSIERADAADWVERHFATPKSGVVKVLVHTVVWQYLPEETQARITRAMEHAGSQATEDAGIAWLMMEHDGLGRGGGLHLRQWPGGEDRLLGRFDYHGRWAHGIPDIHP